MISTNKTLDKIGSYRISNTLKWTNEQTDQIMDGNTCSLFNHYPISFILNWPIAYIYSDIDSRYYKTIS